MPRELTPTVYKDNLFHFKIIVIFALIFETKSSPFPLK